MVQMTQEDWRRVADAVLIWSGWGRSSYPLNDEQAVIQHFGPDGSAKLLPVLRELVDAFFSSDARFTAADVPEMAAVSTRQFTDKFPDVPEEAARALAWCYTFAYK